MPKSKKRRNAKTKNRQNHTTTTTLKHPGYNQTCPKDLLIEEFGEDGASWLQDEYGRPLTRAEFQLEQCIRRDAFMLDDPFTGPETVTAQKISEILDLTFHVSMLIAKGAGLSHPLIQEAEELAALDPIDHAAESADVAREAYRCGAIRLNARSMWDFGAEELKR